MAEAGWKRFLTETTSNPLLPLVDLLDQFQSAPPLYPNEEPARVNGK